MDGSISLSLEQRFSLRSFQTQVDRMSHEQAQEFLVKLYEQMLYKEMQYKKLLRKDWGICESDTLSH